MSRGYVWTDTSTWTAEERIAYAVQFIKMYAYIDGAHHKQWLLDRVLYFLLGAAGYDEWRARYNQQVDVNNEPVLPWDPGIAP